MKLYKSKITTKYGESLYHLGNQKDSIRFILMQNEVDNMEVDLNQLVKDNRLMSVKEWQVFYPNYIVK